MVKEVEQLMNDESLNNLKSLWEKLDDQKTENENNKKEIQNSFDNVTLRYKKNSKWIPPNFAKLPTQHYGAKSSNQFSMAYNEDERRIHGSPSVHLFYLCSINI